MWDNADERVWCFLGTAGWLLRIRSKCDTLGMVIKKEGGSSELNGLW